MLKGTYQNTVYDFYVTLKDAEQYINSGRFPVPLDFDTVYLMKFTNDMSGSVKYAYPLVRLVNDRYSLMWVFNSSLADENIYQGKVNFDETGYWKYEVFWMYKAETLTQLNCDLFNPLERGTWECTNTAGAVIDSGTLDTDESTNPVYFIDLLSNSTYSIEEYSTCHPPPFAQISTSVNTISQNISLIACLTGSRELLFTKVERALDTVDFTITSNTAIGKEIRFTSSTRIYSHIVTTLPETVVMTVETSTGVEDFKDYTVQIYDAGVLYQTYNPVKAVRKPQQFRGGYIMASNNEYEPVCSFGTPLGSIFFTWNGTGNSPNGGYITEFQAPIEIGKLLIEEPQGDEQVKYTQHESPKDTNYIYND